MSAPVETSAVKPLTEGDGGVRETGPLEDLNTLQRELRNLVHDQLQLAALELRLAAQSLMSMISIAICIGALLVLAWVGLMAAAALSLVTLGFQPALALLVVTALTLVLALALRSFTHHHSRNMGFPATLRTLKPAAPVARDRETT